MLGKVVALTLLVLLCLAGGCAWKLYKYHDCLKVGHSRSYCIENFLMKE